MTSKFRTRQVMSRIAEASRDPRTDEINATLLAEDTDFLCGPWPGEVIPDWVSEMAVDLAYADDRRRTLAEHSRGGIV